MYAGKGVISCIIPNDLRPQTVNGHTPIDYIPNPFGIFSRMNLGQIAEMVISKNVKHCDKIIKTNPEKTEEQIKWLNNNVIRYMNSPKYFSRVENLIVKLKDKSFQEKFINNVQDNNLYIEGSSFSEIDLRNILKCGLNPQEDILIKKDLLVFMEDTMKTKFPFKKENQVIKDIFCSTMYMQKLFKITSKIIAARDLGNLKSISQQPVRGRAMKGGSKLGQMEIEGMLANGCDKALKEFMSVKSDWVHGKKDLVKQFITSGEYKFPDDIEVTSQTRNVVNILIDFLKD